MVTRQSAVAMNGSEYVHQLIQQLDEAYHHNDKADVGSRLDRCVCVGLRVTRAAVRSTDDIGDFDCACLLESANLCEQ